MKNIIKVAVVVRIGDQQFEHEVSCATDSQPTVTVLARRYDRDPGRLGQLGASGCLDLSNNTMDYAGFLKTKAKLDWKVRAIKQLREDTDMNLKDAKAAIDAIWA